MLQSEIGDDHGLCLASNERITSIGWIGGGVSPLQGTAEARIWKDVTGLYTIDADLGRFR